MAEISFGRLRPVHTTLVILGFGGSAPFATSYYVVQRTCQARLASDRVANLTLWGWQLSVLIGVIGHMKGVTEGKEYAEFPWYIDILITVTWVCCFTVFVLILRRRSEPHICVANWFYLASILAIALLHVLRNLSVPVGLFNTTPYLFDLGVHRQDFFWQAGLLMIAATHLAWLLVASATGLTFVLYWGDAPSWRGIASSARRLARPMRRPCSWPRRPT